MDPTVSVSRGVFVSKGGYQKKNNKNLKKSLPFFERCFSVEPWYSTFKQNWSTIEGRLQSLTLKTYNSVLSEVVTYVRECYDGVDTDTLESLVPAATLLTGVNQPDHLQQFTALTDKIRGEATPHIATVHAQDAPTVRHLVESAVYQLVNFDADNMDVSIDADNSFGSPAKKHKIKKGHCTMTTLKKWYNSKYNDTNHGVTSPRKKKKLASKPQPIVIIIPDFESFNCEVLQDFVTIVSWYTTSMPLLLVFGVATSVSALHKSFPYHVSSKLLIKVFQSHSSTAYLNQVLEEVFLTHACPFQLSGRAFELFTDVFLFYDFSVTGFTRSIKYCMMDHYYGDNVQSLCCERTQISSAVAKLNTEDLENVRRLPSFRPYVEAQDCRTRISLLEDEHFLRLHLEQGLNAFHEYLFNFHAALKVLFAFVKELPKKVLGKQIRELYVRCTSETITTTSDFKECIQLLKFQSKFQLLDTIGGSLKTLNSVLQPTSSVKALHLTPLKNSPSKYNKNVVTEKKEHGDMTSVRVELAVFMDQIKNANLETSAGVSEETRCDSEPENVPMMNRLKLKESLLKATKAERIQSEFEMIRSRLIDYLVDLFDKYLRPPFLQPFHEIFVFNNVAGVKRHIVGAPRGAIHTALNNPVAYLQCTCCDLPTPDSISATLPDTSIAYKLHLECGKLINLYDWLQAFAAIVEPTLDGDGEERRDIPLHVQARFTRAVAELQFLGFIKASKRKTDHVTRLTW